MAKRVATVLLLLVFVCAALPWHAAAEQFPTLRWGSTGYYVRLAQRKLSAWGYYKGAVDGVYGRRMYAGVTYFQRKNGLRVDGLVGPATWRALGYNPTPAAAAAPASRNLELLARVITAEARGEPYEGQVAVGAVLLNRVNDSRFPNTLAGVVYQPNAFESVSNGSIYRAPSASAWRAARDALNGWDPTYGAVYFWNPAKPVNPWVWTRKIVRRIGNHVFAK